MDSGKRTFGPGRGSRRILVTALVLSLVLPLTSMASSLPPAYARTSVTISGSGTFADTYVKILSIQVVGGNTVIKDEGLGQVTGMLSGIYAFAATITVQPNGMATYSAVDGCQCTIRGNTGGLLFNEQGSGNEMTGAFNSQAVITQSSNALKGMTGTAILTGLQDPLTSLTSGTYTITLSLPSSSKTSLASYSTQATTSGLVRTSDDAKSLAPSPSQTIAPPTSSSGKVVSHSIATTHIDDKHLATKTPPPNPGAPTSNTHVPSPHRQRSP